MEYNVRHWADTRSIERISCSNNNSNNSNLSMHEGLQSLRVLVMICVTLVNTQTHT